MKNSFRAPVAVTLLAGFPVLVLALVAAIVVVEVFAFRNRLSHGLEFAVFAAPATYVLLRALLTFDRAGEVPGLLVTAETQPELRDLVRELAETVGTAPPDEVRIMNRVNAAVHERTRWFGLRVTERTLFIGAPLFAGLGVAELRAVLGHEFAHYSSRDTRFAGATYRGRVAILRVLSGLDGASWFSRLLRPLFQVYGWVYFAVSGRVSRDQELAADVAAARVAGTAAATAALREIEALDAVWRVFTREYLVMGWNAGYLPDRPAEGCRLLLTDETRAQEPARPRQNPPEASPFDNHPPTAERIRVLEAAGVIPMPEVEDRPASELLRDAEEVLDAAWFAELSDEGRTSSAPTGTRSPTSLHGTSSVNWRRKSCEAARWATCSTRWTPGGRQTWSIPTCRSRLRRTSGLAGSSCPNPLASGCRSWPCRRPPARAARGGPSRGRR
ncbi:M48 family metalloprotease [Amycolatopsis sp. NPDC051372]|uniref:M48 family metalloprotease n=1 Tax=Amycolatopsis sp. NPDC051372 TaxID=3155669 RepID=UPI00342C1B8D